MTDRIHPLAALMEARGIKTHKELADLAGVSTASVQKVIAGTRMRSSLAVYKIAQALDVDVHDVLEDGQVEFVRLFG